MGSNPSISTHGLRTTNVILVSRYLDIKASKHVLFETQNTNMNQKPENLTSSLLLIFTSSQSSHLPLCSLLLPPWCCSLTNSLSTPLSLSLIKSSLPSLIPHPSLWQWRMAAFTLLSPLHISLPIRLTTHIHTHWLFIPLSSHLPQTPTPSLFTLFPPGFILLQFYTPSCALLSHFPVFLFLYFTRYFFFLSVSISNVVLLSTALSIHSGSLKRTEYDRGMTVEW